MYEGSYENMWLECIVNSQNTREPYADPLTDKFYNDDAMINSLGIVYQTISYIDTLMWHINSWQSKHSYTSDLNLFYK